MFMAGGAVAAALDGPAIFQVTPLRIDLGGEKTIDRLKISNQSDRALAVQLRVFSWHQDENGDRYSRSDAVQVTPGIIEMPAGGSQHFQVRIDAPADKPETRYRLVIDELPDPGAADGGLRTRLRMTLPLFVSTADARPAALVWRLDKTNGLSVVNRGERTARLSAPAIVDSDGNIVTGLTNPPRYVHGGVRLTVRTDNPLTCQPGAYWVISGGERPGNALMPITCD